MTLVRLGYVAMSMHLENCSPSQTMTYSQFSKIKDREAAIRKLERIANSNLENCLRLLRHNVAHDISFFRLSSKIIPLANHPELPRWDYLTPLKAQLAEIAAFLHNHPDMRVDFHPDHFVLLNTTDAETLKMSVKTLRMHRGLLKGMGIKPEHRCVLHVGGGYGDHEKALEQFIHNWGLIPETIQQMVMLENDDTTFTLSETLYLCEKLGIPLVFDYHHYLAHHPETESWETQWDRVIESWSHVKIPPKMHISSPRSKKEFRAHAQHVDSVMFLDFLQHVKGSVPQIDCMIEAKQKDDALFQLMEQLRTYKEIEVIDGGSFFIH
ncbi:UV DNA damage repair endonuclease UvsE [Bacillus sp. V59.32b]|uniref:UV DNA damage repair endonuclease UvsE n=1 Tax=Bacillus sp. V59.32b TaxID=1758642 RepID=UPI000E3DD8CF|nr:UV DNA damage repair endonuclease UvsE [Bacillus sp. V59.32b]RFU68690.1 UV DNA damage repair endonuclease UvsE [Bacillus sp. V59.32b]